MKTTPGWIAIISMSLLLAACGRNDPEKAPETAAVPAAAAPTVFESMTGTLIPTSNRIWELAGDLYDDNGNIDSKKLTDAQWTELKETAARMGAGAKVLAEASGIKVAAAGVKIQGEGTEGAVSAEHVQKAIDADPKAFSEAAARLVAISDELVVAAAAHDGKKTDEISARLTEVCGACHVRFWDPGDPPPR